MINNLPEATKKDLGTQTPKRQIIRPCSIVVLTTASLMLSACGGDSKLNPNTLESKQALVKSAKIAAPSEPDIGSLTSAPIVTKDPANQQVLIGSTATFAVAASGTPTVQWQYQEPNKTSGTPTRPGGVISPTSTVSPIKCTNSPRCFVLSPDDGWVSIPSATALNYTTPTATLIQSGRQYRAKLRNGAGISYTLPAILTVTNTISAPFISADPNDQTVQEGMFGLFSVAGGGSSPLSYQWLKNGTPIAGATGKEALIYAEPGDIGITYQIAVRIGNGAGSITSKIASLNVRAAGTPINAAQGGTVEGANEANLNVPPGALTSNQTIALWSETVDPKSLPAGFAAVGDSVRIDPSALSFKTPVKLTLQAPELIPNGMSLAIVRLDIAPPAANLNATTGQNLTATNPTPVLGANLNLGRAAAQINRPTISARLVQATGTGASNNINCANPMRVSAGSLFSKFISSSGSYAALLVPTANCATIDPPPAPDGLPVDTNQACEKDTDFARVAGVTSDPERSLLNRHVDCRSTISSELEIKEWDANANSFLIGTAKVEMQLATFGVSKKLSKTYRARVRLTEFTLDTNYAGNTKKPVIKLRPTFACSTNFNANGGTCNVGKTPEFTLDTGSLNKWSERQDAEVSFNWVYSQGPDESKDFEAFLFSIDQWEFTINGTPYEPPLGQVAHTSANFGYPPILRCDRAVAKGGASKGCVFIEAAPVFRLAPWPEAAEHVSEAQAKGSPGAFKLKAGTRAIADDTVTGTNALLRAKVMRVIDANRYAACTGGTSALFELRPKQYSATCSPTSGNCSCDEYPFASTWNGGRLQPNTTSVKSINLSQNVNSGSGLGTFYLNERLIDQTVDDGVTFKVADPLPNQNSADSFWVKGK